MRMSLTLIYLALGVSWLVLPASAAQVGGGSRELSELTYDDWSMFGTEVQGANAVAIETMTLQNEGWQRDTVVSEPPEPTLAAPA